MKDAENECLLESMTLRRKVSGTSVVPGKVLRTWVKMSGWSRTTAGGKPRLWTGATVEAFRELQLTSRHVAVACCW